LQESWKAWVLYSQTIDRTTNFYSSVLRFEPCLNIAVKSHRLKELKDFQRLAPAGIAKPIRVHRNKA